MYRKIGLIAGAAILGAATVYIPDPTFLEPWLGDGGGALWWQVLPWALLAVS